MTKPHVEWTKRLILFLGLSVLLVVIDFVTKWIVQNNVALGSPIEVIPNFFYINKSYNTAIAFSLGSTWGIWGRILNITISLVLSGVIYFYWLTHDHKMGRLERIIALLLSAGAVGNLIDRAFYWEGTVGFNGVIDFMQFYLGGGPSAPYNFFNPFATFNFADACITVGLFLLIAFIIIDMIKNRDTSLKNDPRNVVAPTSIPHEKTLTEENNEAPVTEEAPVETPKENVDE